MTGSASTNGQQVSAGNQISADSRVATRNEALAWIASQLIWERRLREFVEAKAVARAAAGLDGVLPVGTAAVAAPTVMGHDRDDLDQGAGVANGMEAVGSVA